MTAGKTWDDPDGPMVEPAPDPAIQARVDATLAELGDTARQVLVVQGRRVSDRLAAEARERRDRIESSIAMSEYVAARPGRYGQPSAAEMERRRSTFDGVLDEKHLALRADPDRIARDNRRRRRRAA